MRYTTLILLFIVTHLALQAIPARPGKRVVTLPDGSSRTVVIRGDEREHWLETPAGQKIGERIVSRSLTERRRQMAPQISRRAAEAKAGDLLLEGSFPTTGRHKLLALLINYANTTPTYSREQFDAMLNGEGYGGVGSFRDYFLDQSSGQLDIQTTVTPWVTVSQPKQYYNIDNTPSLIAEALRQLDGQIDLRQFDNDHDGILDGLIVIHAGHGQEATGDATDIWSHSSTIYGMQYDGVQVYRYTIEPECLHNGPSTIGVFCHEFGHNLGALDYYDTNYSSGGAYGGTGPWDLMGEGAWNGPNGNGSHPAPFSAWQKWQFGWLTPELMEQSRAAVKLSTGIARRMNTTTEGDYYFLENVQNDSPWTRYLPGHGLLLTHVIESVFRQKMGLNSINATYPQGIYTVCADAHCDPAEGQPSSYGDLTSSATTFPGTRNHTEFSDATLPSSHSADGRFGYVALKNINETANGIVSFDFIQGEAPQRPQELTARVSDGSVFLTWQFPDNKIAPTSCHVFRDGNAIATITATAPQTHEWSFIDQPTSSAGLVTYSVDALYPDGLTSSVSTISTRIPPQVAANLSAEIARSVDGAKQLRVQWDIPSELTRCRNNLDYDLVDHYASLLRYAHRFRADDLLPHIGRQIRSVTFIPQQPSTDASYKICVWRMPAEEGHELPGKFTHDALTLVAERSVNEFSPTYQRTLPFLTRPTIEAGYDYLVGVEIASRLGVAQLVTDQSEVHDGLGNLMSIGGGTWQTDPSAHGNYILSATLTGDVSEADMKSLIILSSTDPYSLFSEAWRPFDVSSDLLLPLGFTLMAQGQRLAETTDHTIAFPLEALAPLSNEASVLDLRLYSSYKGMQHSSPLQCSVGLAGEDVGISQSYSPTAASKCYDVSGRHVTIPSQGVYVLNGRKMIR